MKYKKIFVLSIISQIIFDSKEAYTFLVDRCVYVLQMSQNYISWLHILMFVWTKLGDGMKFLGKWTV